MARPRKFSHEQAARMRAQGHTWTQIGEKLGVTATAAMYAARDHQPNPPPAGRPTLILVPVPVEQLRAGDTIRPTSRGPLRRIAQVERYDDDTFVVVTADGHQLVPRHAGECWMTERWSDGERALGVVA